MRDDGVAGNLLEMASADNTSSVPASAVATAVASFKGRGNCCEVAGLSPNTRYYFRVRVVTSRTRSALSAPLEVGPCILCGRRRYTYGIRNVTGRCHYLPNLSASATAHSHQSRHKGKINMKQALPTFEMRPFSLVRRSRSTTETHTFKLSDASTAHARIVRCYIPDCR